MDLASLDWRKYQRDIERERLRMSSRLIKIAIEDRKHTVELELKYLTGLREVATPEEACELDVQLESLRVQLSKIDADLAARVDREKAELGSGPRGEEPGLDPSATRQTSEPINYVLMLRQVLEKRKRPNESKTAVFNDWLEEHRDLSRTQVTDYLGGRADGRVGKEKCRAIEAAILESAEALGLATRINSD
jgi:hypothetical protein